VPEEQMTSAQRKLKRGVEHIRTLCGEATTFEDSRAYLFESEREVRSPKEIVYRCFAVKQEPMPLHWPLLAGEAIQNLRSALDHLVYERSGGNKQTQFPIFINPDDFAARAPRRMKGVPDSLQTVIESHHRTPISTFVVRADDGVEDVQVEPIFSYEVRIEGRPVATLKAIGNHVYRVMAEVDTGKPLSMFAPYPL
jgi:hypothetical protein